MLSYQHIYHAGNLADVHKHLMLASVLDYLTRKDKPLTYIETHAGRGVYDLADASARKTGDAAAGIETVLRDLPGDHPYVRVVMAVRAELGPAFYPGSPRLAAGLLRPTDSIHLAELHPAEFAELERSMKAFVARCYRQDGFEAALSLCPPTPRRGLMLIDPSWEIKSDYRTIPGQIGKLTRAWNVGIVMLWYPLLALKAHGPMIAALERAHPEALRHEVRFPPAPEGHGMVGSGLFIIRPPYGLDRQAKEVSQRFARWFPNCDGDLR